MSADPTETDRQPLSRARVLDEAIAIADRDGIGSLSMRNLAKALGFEPMSLYNHVDNKNDLLDAMVDQVVGELTYPPEGTPWRQAIRDHVVSYRAALEARPWTVQLIATRLPGPARIAQLEWQLATFANSGLDHEVAHHGFHAIGNHVIGYTMFAEAMPDAGDQDEMIHKFLATLDPDQHRHMIDHVALHTDPEANPGESFEFVLDLILDGLERAG